jgi:uncharacterized membrane protein YkvA (DUF1232 family)
MDAHESANAHDSHIGPKGAAWVRQRAEQYAEDPEKVQSLVDQAMRKAHRRRDALKEVWDSLMSLMRMLRAWIRGEYPAIPWQTLLLATSAVLYFAMPMDLIPDWVFALGFVDDAAVIAWVIQSIKEDIDAFLTWENEQQ